MFEAQTLPPETLSQANALAHAPAPARAGEPNTLYSSHLTEAICAQVALGRPLTAVCEDPGMPHRSTVVRWVHDHPEFAQALDEARCRSETGGPGPQSTYCEAMARIVCARHAHGETLPAICRDPLMPPLSTVISWSRHNRDFSIALSAAREAHADMITERSMELLEAADAKAANPGAARLLSVRLGHLRWLAAIRSPRSHGRIRAKSSA
jgi:hypothetical protein